MARSSYQYTLTHSYNIMYVVVSSPARFSNNACIETLGMKLAYNIILVAKLVCKAAMHLNFCYYRAK